MDEKTNQPNTPPWAPYTPENYTPPVKTFFPTGKKEAVFAGFILLVALALCNFTIWGGFNLGFSIAAAVCILCITGYLLMAGCKPTAYSMTLIGLSTVIAASFGRSDDGFVKFVMLCFLLVSTSLGFSLLAGQNLRAPGGVSSLLDAPGAVFSLGLGKLPEAFRGMGQGFRRSGKLGQKGGAVALGLVIAVPILAIVIPLLISADAAFDGLVQLLPDFDFSEALVTVIFGAPTAAVLYTLGTALRHSPKRAPAASRERKGLSAMTVNTVLGAVCLVYGVYLVSQLAYFVGGFAGILPEGYTTAEYARRGFFEMAWLCAINLSLIAALLGASKGRPLSTRLLCLFIGAVTLFMVAAASGKMFLYIGSYGLTRLRVLTQIVMLFLALTTALVMVWLFVPKLPYMKAVMVAGLLIGGAVAWADVDTQVARYNVETYLSGKMETVDVFYLQRLGHGAVPYIAKLAEEATDKEVAKDARAALDCTRIYAGDDFREWNYVNSKAGEYLKTEE